MIYVIKAVGTEYVKIGIAENPIWRLRELQTGAPMLLVLVAAADWPDSTERRLHRVLRQYRVRGEWFSIEPSILDSLIKLMQSGASNPNGWIQSLPAPSRLARVLRIAR